MLRFNTIPLYGCFVLCFGTGLVIALLAHFLFVPYLRRKIDREFELEEVDPELVDDKKGWVNIVNLDCLAGTAKEFECPAAY